jgi:hypothetical protein
MKLKKKVELKTKKVQKDTYKRQISLRVSYQQRLPHDKVNMELQLDATITVLLISKISSTCFGQTFAHLQERKT